MPKLFIDACTIILIFCCWQSGKVNVASMEPFSDQNIFRELSRDALNSKDYFTSSDREPCSSCPTEPCSPNLKVRVFELTKLASHLPSAQTPGKQLYRSYLKSCFKRKFRLQMESTVVSKINDSKMRAPAGILHFAAQQAGTCQRMQRRRWESDAWTRNRQKRGKERKSVISFSKEGHHVDLFNLEHSSSKTNGLVFRRIKYTLAAATFLFYFFYTGAVHYVVKQANTLFLCLSSF